MNVPTVNNLELKAVDYRVSMGKIYAFVTCIDIQSHGRGKQEKRYWGEVLFRDDAEEIPQVMMYGAHWDYLP